MCVKDGVSQELEEGHILRQSQDGSIAVLARPDGLIVRVSSDIHRVPLIIQVNDTYAVKQDGLNVIVKCCPRIPDMKRRFCRTTTKPVKDPYARYMPKLPHVLRFGNDIEASDWLTYMQNEIRAAYTRPPASGATSGEPRKLLIIVNPIGGRGKGVQIFNRFVKPMIEDAGTEYELFVTSGHSHGSEIARNFDASIIGGICIVGGDGLLSEVLNGMYSRPDRDEVIKYPIGVVPAGSSNCLACSIGMRHLIAAAFAVVRGQTKPLDVLKVKFVKEDRVMLAVCGVSYGFISEVNTHAGKWRWLLGPSRYTFLGFRTLLRSPMMYHVECRYLPSELTDKVYEEKFASTICGPDCRACAEFSKTDNSPHPRPAVDEEGWVEGSLDLDARRRRLRPNAAEIDSSTMLLFSITNVSIRQSQTQAAWNPYCHMASGCMDLVMMPVITRFQLLKFFKTFSKANDQHLTYNRDIFSVIKAKAVEMHISSSNLPDWEKTIHIAIDGEIYPLQPLRVDSMHAFLNIMCT